MYDIIEVKDLHYNINKKSILENITFKVKVGEFLTILSCNSSGSSILAQILSGIFIPKSYVKIDNMILNPKNRKDIRKKIIYLTECSENFLIGDVVIDDIYFYLGLKGQDEDKIDEKIEKFSKGINIKSMLSKDSNRLSGGEKQIISLFLALASEPKILIIDGGLSMIDEISKRKIFTLLKQYNKKGMTILNFTKDSEDSLYGTSIMLLCNDKVILHEKKENTFKKYKLFNENKVKLPFVVELSLKLTYYKVIDHVYYDMKKLVNDLWQ